MSEEKKAGPVTIASLELENVKRVRAMTLAPKPDGLTVIGGRNGQGKTSVLDAIAWALGGERKRPERPTRDGAAVPAHLKVTLSNGLVAERGGKNGSLKVSDPEGKKAGQQLINAFVGELALDLPKFMAMGDREKADELLRIIGVGDELARLDKRLDELTEERKSLGQQKRAKRKVAEDAPRYESAPDELVSAADLVRQHEEILARNGENRRLRDRKGQLEERSSLVAREIVSLTDQMRQIKERIDQKSEEADQIAADLETAAKTVEQLADESTEEVERALADVDATNEMVRANQRRHDMEEEADALDAEYAEVNEDVESVRGARARLLDGADLPLEGLSVEDGKLVYHKATWSEMSGSEQLRVATAIVRRLKPECGFVLVDKLEQMDPQTLEEFGAWCAGEGLQVIGTRVATDGTCSVVIEDGRVAGDERPDPAPEPEAFDFDGAPEAEAAEPKKWKEL
jgi:hypothetical protein